MLTVAPPGRPLQVADAHARGIRPERRSKELLNMRRSEAVLAANNEFGKAAKVRL